MVNLKSFYGKFEEFALSWKMGAIVAIIAADNVSLRVECRQIVLFSVCIRIYNLISCILSLAYVYKLRSHGYKELKGNRNMEHFSIIRKNLSCFRRLVIDCFQTLFSTLRNQFSKYIVCNTFIE